MTSKMFLTSVAAVMLAMPAMAEPWPSNDIMLENKTYDNAATEEHMLVSSDGATANATADYEAILYQIAAGKYLPANTEYDNATGTGAVECPENSYCGGLSNATYSAENQGINACPDGFALSASGASSQKECYRTCTTSDVAHSTVVSGGYYYGDNNQCEPTECAKGWHIKAGQSVDLAEEFSKASQVDSETTTYAYIDNNGSYYESTWHGTSKEQSYYGISNNNEWATSLDDYAFGVVKGTARCSTQSGSYEEVAAGEVPEAFGNGQYCWCNITGYKAPGKTSFKNLSSAWVFDYGHSSAAVCANDCARDCAGGVLFGGVYSLRFRAALFGSVSATPALATCAANTINIQWDGIDEPTTVTYGGDITTPVSAEKRPGQRFKGWKFTTPGQTTGE